MGSTWSSAWSAAFGYPARTDWQSVVVWWELRRIPYNLIVGVVGAISLVSTFFLIVASGELEPGEDAIEPLAVIFFPPLIMLAFNVCYTAGWIVELLIRSASDHDASSVGPALFIGGLAFSLALVSLPAVFWAVVGVGKLALG